MPKNLLTSGMLSGSFMSRIVFTSAGINGLAQVIELSLGEFKLLRVECQAALRQSVQHFLQSGIMLMLIFAKDKDIVLDKSLSAIHAECCPSSGIIWVLVRCPKEEV